REATSDAEETAKPGDALRHALTALVRDQGADVARLRAAALPLFKPALAEARNNARQYLEGGGTGLAAAQMLSGAMDTVIHVFYAQHPTDSEHIAVVAVGGYGRGALAPGSDIDLLFVLPYKQTAWGESVVEFMLYLLWDLGLKVGHATRSVDDCIRHAKSDY